MPRPRSAREESPHRKPFSATPSPRSKYSFPVVNTPVLRRPRHNSENQPPEVPLNVKANSPFSETYGSPALHSSKPTSAKGKHHGSLSLPPRPPPPRPSPSTNSVKNGHDAQGNVKRKLNLEPSVCADASVSCSSLHESDNGVKVIIRLRPCNQKEESEDTKDATQIVERISSDSLWLADQNFTFDYVAGQDSSQQSIYEIVGQPLVENCLQGFNSSIFAYGQTGSGKTYTMWGATQDLMAQPPSEERGLTPRVFECLFQRIEEEEKKNVDKQLRYQCRCSFFEIYNEQITDLLEPSQKALQVREDTKTGVYVENLTEEFVSSVVDVFRLMAKGLGNRKVASTSMNLESSRSHTLFTCVIESRCKSMSDGVSSVRTSRMNLVDLAGSERQKLTGAAGDRLKEAGNINRSLSQLGNLINILAEVSQSGKPRHIPYRDSRLTFLLQESLGGNAKLAMICAISPASSCKSETLSTLRFAQRAKSIQNKAVVNEETEDDVKILREQIRQLKDELMRMKSNETIPGAAGSYSTSWNARRSYNLLRMSLSRPMTLPHTDTDTDEEMEIDEDAVECVDEMATPSAQMDDSGKTNSEIIAIDGGLQIGSHFPDIKMPLTQILHEDVGLGNLVKSPAENASVSSCSTALADPLNGLTGGQNGTEGHLEEIKSGDLLVQQCSLQSQPHAQAENMKIHVNDSDDNTVNVSQSSSLEKVLVPTMQETSDISAQCEVNMSPLKESHVSVVENSILETECETCEKQASDDVKLFSFHLDPLLQAEDDGVCGLAESPLQACPSVELECRTGECTPDGRDTEVLSCITDNKCQSSSPKEPLVKSEADQIFFQKLDPATPGVTSRLSVSDDFGSVTMSTEFHGAQLQPHYLEDLSVVDLPQARADVIQSWVADDISQQDVEGDKAHGHGGDEDLSEEENRVSNTPDTQPVLKSPVLCISPHLASASLEAPILSISPRLGQDKSKSFCSRGAVPVVSEDTNIETCRMSCAEFYDAETDLQLQKSVTTSALEAPSVNSNARSSQNLSSPTDRLAASLHRGLQILENHQKKVSSTRMSMVRFSFQNPEWDKPIPSNTVSKSVQTSPVCVIEKSSENLETMPSNGLLTEQVRESSRLDHVSMDDASTPQKKYDFQSSQNMEAVLVGALRRERAMEEDLNRKNAEIEQLNRLVRQYKHERECNAVIQQSLEDKIARLESLMDGTLPTDSFLNEEWSSLVNEHKMLQKRYDHHPEVTLANIRQQRLCEDIERYKTFCELGERDSFLQEVSQLRNQLQYYMELDMARPAKQRQRSLTPQAKSSASDDNGADESTLSDKLQTQEDNPHPITGSEGCQMCEKETAQWLERENDWMLVLEELRAEVEEYKQLAETRKHEVGGQQRCAEEMKEALQMAMEGHARLLDQYAELQEKHIGLLAKHRKIRDAMQNARKKAGKLGFLGCGKWFEAQAAELIAVKLEREQERKAAKEQIDGLQAQLRDTADAVQAAGELLVRLKEAEEATLIAQDAAALAEQDADRLYRVIDKLKRRHSTEIATLQQRLLESRFQKSSVCPMCVMAERVKFEFTGVDNEEAEAALEAQHLAAQAAKDQAAVPFHGAEEPSYDGGDLYMQGLDDFHASETDDRWYDDAQTCNI